LEMTTCGLALGEAREVDRNTEKGGVVQRPAFSSYFVLARRLDRPEPRIVWVRVADLDPGNIQEAESLLNKFPVGSTIDPRWDAVYREWVLRDGSTASLGAKIGDIVPEEVKEEVKKKTSKKTSKKVAAAK